MTDDDNSPAPEAEPGALEGSEGINVAGLISIIVFYLVVLLIGLWAGWRQRKVAKQQGRSSNDQEEVMLAGRDIGLFVGIMTMGGMYFLDDGALLTISLNFTILSKYVWRYHLAYFIYTEFQQHGLVGVSSMALHKKHTRQD